MDWVPALGLASATAPLDRLMQSPPITLAIDRAGQSTRVVPLYVMVPVRYSGRGLTVRVAAAVVALDRALQMVSTMQRYRLAFIETGGKVSVKVSVFTPE